MTANSHVISRPEVLAPKAIILRAGRRPHALVAIAWSCSSKVSLRKEADAHFVTARATRLGILLH